MVTLLLGFAIQKGYIKSLNQYILDFLPEYKGLPLADQVIIADLSRMSSGLDWEENYYTPLNPTAKAYYGTNVSQLIFSRRFIDQPGKTFKYLSANTQILKILLRRATKKSMTNYVEEKLWNPLEMSQTAL